MDINIFLTFFETNIYLFLLVIPFLSQLGIPLLAMFFIMFGGALATDFNELFILFLIVWFGTISGDILGYFIGKKFFYFQFFQNILNRNKVKYLYNKSKKFFDEKGGISIFFTRFMFTGLGAVTNYIAGFQSFNFRKFSSFVILGEMIYSLELLLLGYFFRDTFEEVLNIISSFGLTIFLGYLLYEMGVHLFKGKKS